MNSKHLSTKIIGAFVRPYILGPPGIWLGNLIREGYGDKFGDFLREKGPEVVEQIAKRIESYTNLEEESFNYDLARAIVSVWETSLGELQGRFPGKTLLDDETKEIKSSRKRLIRFWITRLREAQTEMPLLLDLFRESSDDFLNQRTTAKILDNISDPQSAEEFYWESLEMALIKWARDDDKYPNDWGKTLPEPFRSRVKHVLLSDIRTKIEPVFRNNEQARKAYEYAFTQGVYEFTKKIGRASCRERV